MRLRTDGGPQFTSRALEEFLTRWGVRHIVTSPHYPQSNGHAEAAVKSVKHLIMKVAPTGNIDCEDFDRGLLEVRNTPNHSGRSPAQVLYGHPLRTCVPAHPASFRAEWHAKAEECDRRAAQQAEAAISRYDQHARQLPALQVNQQVRVQDPVTGLWDKVGILMGRGRSRQLYVRLPSGRLLWRNHRHVRPALAPMEDSEDRVPADHESQEPPALRRSPRLQGQAAEIPS